MAVEAEEAEAVAEVEAEDHVGSFSKSAVRGAPDKSADVAPDVRWPSKAVDVCDSTALEGHRTKKLHDIKIGLRLESKTHPRNSRPEFQKKTAMQWEAGSRH